MLRNQCGPNLFDNNLSFHIEQITTSFTTPATKKSHTKFKCLNYLQHFIYAQVWLLLTSSRLWLLQAILLQTPAFISKKHREDVWFEISGRTLQLKREKWWLYVVLWFMMFLISLGLWNTMCSWMLDIWCDETSLSKLVFIVPPTGFLSSLVTKKQPQHSANHSDHIKQWTCASSGGWS